MAQTSWDSFGLGEFTSCGVREGALFCWGSLQSGLIGEPRFGVELEQTQIGVDLGWTATVVGAGQACSLRDGRLYCWGRTGVYPNYGHGTQWSPGPILSPDPL